MNYCKKSMCECLEFVAIADDPDECVCQHSVDDHYIAGEASDAYEDEDAFADAYTDA